MRDGQIPGVRQCQQRRTAAHSLEAPRGPTVQPELRCPSLSEHLDVFPQDAERAPRAERLHPGLLGRKSGGQRRRGIAVREAIVDLVRGEEPVEETLTVAIEQIPDTVYFGRVETNPDDIHTHRHRGRASPHRAACRRGRLRHMEQRVDSLVLQGNGRFRLEQGPWGQVLICEPLFDLAPHLFSTRSFAADARLAGADGREAIAACLAVEPTHVHDVSQVHGTDVYVVSAQPRIEPRPCADIIVTQAPTEVVAVRSADCVPLLLADARTGAVAAVHAGWRGTAAGAVAQAVLALHSLVGTDPSDLVVAIGPSIGPCCYQVGTDVRRVFTERTGQEEVTAWFAPDGPAWRLDLWRANSDQLVASGVSPQAIHSSRQCTACDLTRYYSFRKEGAGAGRLHAAIRGATRL